MSRRRPTRSLFLHHLTPMWFMDEVTLAFLEVNEAAIRHYGYTRDEFSRMTIQDIRLPDEVPLGSAHGQRPHAARGHERVEQPGMWRHRTRDGTCIDVDVAWSAVVFRGRQARLVVAYDVSERVRGGAALRKAYEELERRMQERASALAQANATLRAEVAERVRAEAEALQRQREAEVLAQLAQTLNTSLELDIVLQRVTEGAQELCGSERGLLMLREPGGESLVSRYQVGFPRMPYVDLRVEPGKGIGGQVVATGRPLRTADYAADPRFSKDYVDYIRIDGRLAMLTVPIIIGARVEGVLYVSNPTSRPFTAQHEVVLMRLADHAATAIRNAQLYHAAQDELGRRTAAEAQLQTSLREKEVLLREIHHRVKNNLQIVSSLLNLQLRAVDDPHLRALVQDSRRRVQAMALIHEALYQADDLSRVPFEMYVRRLAAQLLRAYNVAPRRIRLSIQADPFTLNIDKAAPCALIFHELFSNALKHAFPDGRPGTIAVALHCTSHQLVLSVQDSGVGVPPGLDWRHTNTLGLKLISMLTEQLGGTLRLDRQGGTAFTLTVPLL